jgi:hypothetical protein
VVPARLAIGQRHTWYASNRRVSSYVPSISYRYPHLLYYAMASCQLLQDITTFYRTPSKQRILEIVGLRVRECGRITFIITVLVHVTLAR